VLDDIASKLNDLNSTNMLNNQINVIKERDELQTKLEALIWFVNPHQPGQKEVLDDMSSEDLQLLRDQWKCMEAYLKILNERIGRFTTLPEKTSDQ
jgi:hypothetical protein